MLFNVIYNLNEKNASIFSSNLRYFVDWKMNESRLNFELMRQESALLILLQVQLEICFEVCAVSGNIGFPRQPKIANILFWRISYVVVDRLRETIW